MTQKIHQSTQLSHTQKCPCCHNLASRRYFLKSLLSGVFSLSILQSTKPAKAATHPAKALVLSCIDFRFVNTENLFLSKQHLTGEYDWTALAGASLAISGFPHPSDSEAFWDQLDLSYRLHHINKVIIIDHQDCGAYATMIDPNLSQDPVRELQVHTEYLNRAYQSIRDRYPDIQVELYFATLNKGDVKTILPRFTNRNLT